MTGLLLTEAERRRFIEYLRHEINTTTGIIAQMQKINSPVALIRMLQTEVAASAVVCDKLAKTESMTLGEK